MYFKYYHSQVF